MTITPLAFPELYLITPLIHSDARGSFTELIREPQLRELSGLPLHFMQDNESESAFGVLRGLHFQRPPFAQSKLVRVVQGRVLDVVVDIRHGSPRFGQSLAVELCADNKQQLFIPRGFAHGFLVLSNTALVQYKVDNSYSPAHDAGLAFDDPALNIHWPVAGQALLLSAKDQQQPRLSELNSGFHFGDDYYG
ncbi:dTDP-4-dehydrorhamnose 3,5-epimerase [Arsukibacterium sp.]|uniref:dTDP-4-dehydrorhamnose 3,5-epimerase n=1 Tax=Arsukibacterium sp. TaxID=1977258 RepID=UPI002FD89C93